MHRDVCTQHNIKSKYLRTILTARQLLRNKFQDIEDEFCGLIRNFGYHLDKVKARDFEPR
tara:strand:- start:247 stop:426 length:180 start_codon:yes stop_codon:yes gene_type:complete